MAVLGSWKPVNMFLLPGEARPCERLSFSSSCLMVPAFWFSLPKECRDFRPKARPVPSLGYLLRMVLLVLWRFQTNGFAGRALLFGSGSLVLLIPRVSVTFGLFSCCWPSPRLLTTSRSFPLCPWALIVLGRTVEPLFCLRLELSGNWNCFFLMNASFWFSSFIYWLFCSGVMACFPPGLAGELFDSEEVPLELLPFLWASGGSCLFEWALFSPLLFFLLLILFASLVFFFWGLPTVLESCTAWLVALSSPPSLALRARWAALFQIVFWYPWPMPLLLTAFPTLRDSSPSSSLNLNTRSACTFGS